MTRITGGLKVTGGLKIAGPTAPPPPPSNSPSIAAVNPFGSGNSYLFNGLSQKIIIDASSLTLGTDWTIEWFQIGRAHV